MTLFIVTGTDTGVGKTFVTTRLITELRRRGIDAIGLKPLETGWNEPLSDAAHLAAASGRPVDETVWAYFDLPAAPAVAAAAESRQISVGDLTRWLCAQAEPHDVCLAEGAGGWMVPLDNDHLFCDLVERLQPTGTILVSASRLGTINHTLLTAESIARTSPLLAIVLSVRPSDPPKEAVAHIEEIRKRVAAPVFEFPRDHAQLADLFHVEHHTR